MRKPKETSYNDNATFSQAMEFSKAGNHKAAIPLFLRVVTERPKSGFAYLCLARSYQDIGEHNLAIETYQKMINKKLEPRRKAYFWLAQCYKNAQQFEAALGTFNLLLTQFPNDFDGLLGVAMCHEMMGHFDDAKNAYAYLKKRYPQDKALLITMAHFYAKYEYYDEALEAYEQYQKIHSSDSSVLLGLARCYEEMGRFKAAFNTYEQLKILSPQDKKVLISYAGCFQTVGEYHNALAVYLGLVKTYPHDKNILLGLARCYQQLGQYPKALVVYDTLKAKYTEDRTVILCFARCQQMMGQYHTAITALEALRSRYSRDKTVLLALATCYEEANQYEIAVKICKQIQAYYPTDKVVALSLARCYEGMGQFTHAWQVYVSLQELYTTDKAVCLSLACYHERIGQYEHALKVYETLDHHYFNDKSVRLNLARCYQAMGQYDKALFNFKKLVEKYPQDQVVLLGLAHCYQEMGQYDNSFAIYKELKNLFPASKTVLSSYALACETAGQFAEAFKLHCQLQEHYPDNREVLLNFSRYYEALGQFEVAFSIYDRLKSIYPGDKIVQLSLSRCYQNFGDFENALVVLQQDVAKGTHNKELQLGLARCYQTLRQHESAIRIYEELRKSFSSDKVILLGFTRCYEEMQRYDAAYRIYDLLKELFPHDRSILLGLAYCHYKCNDKEQAYKEINSLIEQFPYYLDAQLALAKFHQFDRNYKAAVQTLHNICRNFPYAVIAKRQLAICYALLNDVKTEDYYKQLIAEFPYDKKVYLDYLQWLIETHRQQEMLANYQLCSKRFESDVVFLEDVASLTQSLAGNQHELKETLALTGHHNLLQLNLSHSIKLILPLEIIVVLDIFERAGYSSYLYGGSIRDLLLGIPVNDFDIKTSAPPARIQELFPTSQKSPHVEDLYTLKQKALHIDINCSSVAINLHAENLDFTINAFYCDKEGKVIYTLPTSFKDLQEQKICTIGSIHRLKEEPIRMLRAVYLSARLNFTIAEDEMNYIKEHAPLIHLKAARVANFLPRLFLRGYAHRSYLQLKAFNLIAPLFPLLKEASEFYEHWLLYQLTLTDQRVQANQMVSINYIHAIILFWPVGCMLKQHDEKTKEQPENVHVNIENIEEIIVNVLNNYRISLSLREEQIDVIKRLLTIFTKQSYQDLARNLASEAPKSIKDIPLGESLPSSTASPNQQVSSPVSLPQKKEHESKTANIALSEAVNKIATPLNTSVSKKQVNLLLQKSIKDIPLGESLPSSTASPNQQVSSPVSLPQKKEHESITASIALAEAASKIATPLNTSVSKKQATQLLQNIKKTPELKAAESPTVKASFQQRKRSPATQTSPTPIHEKHFDAKIYALELLNRGIPRGISVKTDDRKKALSFIELSLMDTKTKLSLKVEIQLLHLIEGALYKRSCYDYLIPNNWASLFFCETYGIRFDDTIYTNALSCLKIIQIIQPQNPKSHSKHMTKIV